MPSDAMPLTEISMLRAAAMKDSGHADERVRTAAVGLNRLLDSHEYHRRRSEEFEAGLVKIRDQDFRGNGCSCMGVARKTLDDARE